MANVSKNQYVHPPTTGILPHPAHAEPPFGQFGARPGQFWFGRCVFVLRCEVVVPRPKVQMAIPNHFVSRLWVFGAAPKHFWPCHLKIGVHPKVFGSRPGDLGLRPKHLGSRHEVVGVRPKQVGARPKLAGSRPRMTIFDQKTKILLLIVNQNLLFVYHILRKSVI